MKLYALCTITCASAFITFSPKTSNCLEKCLRLQHCLAVSYVSCFPPPAETSRGVSCICVTSSHRETEERDLTLSVTFIFVRVPPWLHRSVLDRITDTAKASNIERTEAGYESMAHFIINTEDVADMLRGIDFQTGNGFTAMTTPSLSHIHSYLFASASWSCIAVYLENEACTFFAGEDGKDSGEEAPEDLTTSPGQTGESGRRI